VIGADIADVGEGEIDDLPRIGGIGHHLLISGHRGVEAKLADRLALRPEAAAPDHCPVGQYQYARRSLRRRRMSGVGHGGGHSEKLAMSLSPSG
jgi:hypothetical protein